MKALDREIFRLALPSILANITVPLVGMADMAIAGHLHGPEGAAAYIGGVSVGALLFALLYWNFAFLRAATGGLAAQAFGRGDRSEQSLVLGRALALSAVCSIVLLALQWPCAKLGVLIIGGSEQVSGLALRYFFLRIWAAPATLALMALRGWFIGEQDSASSMKVDLVVNLGNIAASLLLTFPLGLGFDGIALGTVVAQYSGLAYALLIVSRRYPWALKGLKLKACLSGTRDFFTLNADLFVRSLCFMALYLGWNGIAARYGDIPLAVVSLMMNILMLFSYFTDGFAYAGEALSGRFIGAGEGDMLQLTVRRVFFWSMAMAALWMGIYAVAGEGFLRLFTDSDAVLVAARKYLPWLVLMPPLGCAAFTWDGIYTGATSSAEMRNAMLASVLLFFVVWLAFRGLTPGETEALHLLLAAYFVHLAVRTIWLSLRYRRGVLSKISNFVLDGKA